MSGLGCRGRSVPADVLRGGARAPAQPGRRADGSRTPAGGSRASRPDLSRRAQHQGGGGHGRPVGHRRVHARDRGGARPDSIGHLGDRLGRHQHDARRAGPPLGRGRGGGGAVADPRPGGPEPTPGRTAPRHERSDLNARGEPATVAQGLAACDSPACSRQGRDPSAVAPGQAGAGQEAGGGGQGEAARQEGDRAGAGPLRGAGGAGRLLPDHAQARAGHPPTGRQRARRPRRAPRARADPRRDRPRPRPAARGDGPRAVLSRLDDRGRDRSGAGPARRCLPLRGRGQHRHDRAAGRRRDSRSATHRRPRPGGRSGPRGRGPCPRTDALRVAGVRHRAGQGERDSPGAAGAPDGAAADSRPAEALDADQGRRRPARRTRRPGGRAGGPLRQLAGSASATGRNPGPSRSRPSIGSVA